MKNIKKKTALVISLAMAVSMALTACGDSDDNDDDDEESTPAYEVPVENYIKSVQKNDADLYKKSLAKPMADYISDKMGEEYFKEQVEEASKELKDEYGEDVKISYKVKEKEELGKEDLEDLNDRFKETFESESEITSGYRLDVEFIYTGTDISSIDEDDKDVTFEVGKIDGKWAIVDLK